MGVNFCNQAAGGSNGHIWGILKGNMTPSCHHMLQPGYLSHAHYPLSHVHRNRHSFVKSCLFCPWYRNYGQSFKLTVKVEKSYGILCTDINTSQVFQG